VGVEWARKVGDTAHSTRAEGEDAGSVSLVFGMRRGSSFAGRGPIWLEN
jgi:uncharacterized protein involved in copper resistance